MGGGRKGRIKLLQNLRTARKRKMSREEARVTEKLIIEVKKLLKEEV